MRFVNSASVGKYAEIISLMHGKMRKKKSWLAVNVIIIIYRKNVTSDGMRDEFGWRQFKEPSRSDHCEGPTTNVTNNLCERVGHVVTWKIFNCALHCG